MTRQHSRHAVVFGALGQGNRGDDALLCAIVEWMNDRYDAITVMLSEWDDDLLKHVQRRTDSPVIGELTPPMFSRRRPWFGRRNRRECMERLVNRRPGGRIDVFWIGGLLGDVWQHNRLRCLELQWAARFADSSTYFFGDVGEHFVDTAYAHRWVRIAQSLNMHIVVRSQEAAETLREAGLRSEMHYGMDAALFARSLARGIPFVRHHRSDDSVALNPCVTHIDQWKPVWLSVARAAVERRSAVRWISTCDADDLGVCERLASEVAGSHPSARQQIVKGRDAEALLASANYAVTARYHGAIFAIAAGVPTIFCPYGAKVKRLARKLGLDDFILAHEITPDEVAARVLGMMDRIDSGCWKPEIAALTRTMRQHGDALAALEAALELKPVQETLKAISCIP